MSEHPPLRQRHYRVIEELASESKQDLPEASMRRRAVAMTMLGKYMNFPAQPELVSSAEGALEAMVFTLPAYAVEGEDNPLWAVFSDLFLRLPQDTEFHLIIHERIQDRVRDWCTEKNLLHRTRFHTVPDGQRLLIWAEDDYEIVRDASDGAMYIIQPHSHRRGADDYTGYRLGNSLGIGRVKIPLYFEGGNLLTGDDFFLMGADYLVDSMLDLKGTLVPEDGTWATETVERLFCRYLDHRRRLFIVASLLYVPHEHESTFRMNGEEWTEFRHLQNDEGTVQPLFHIDMFLTLAGRGDNGAYRILVGDTRMAAELCGGRVDRAIPEVFDDVALLLERQGFEVIRNPLPVTYVDDPDRRRRKWYYATSNNAILEIRNEKEKTVWLPTYGHGNWPELKKTDEANKRIWEELGFRVVQLGDFHPFAEKSGALHCIEKYFSRGKL